jgi:hypothetical protein
MRPRLPTPCLCLALLGNAGCAAAAASPGFTLHAGDYERLRGTYALEDGHSVHVVGTRRHPRVEFDDGQSAPLEASSATDLLAPDGCTRLHFDFNDNATLARVSVTRAHACPPR